jgi:hypothetical protein
MKRKENDGGPQNVVDHVLECCRQVTNWRCL